MSWTIRDTSAINGHLPIGVAGYSAGWDSAPVEAFIEATPEAGNAFYSGPQHPNVSTGALTLAAAGQGCHTIVIEAWDNAGGWSGYQTYGPVCYDNTPPHSTAILAGPQTGGVYSAPVTVQRTRLGSMQRTMPGI